MVSSKGMIEKQVGKLLEVPLAILSLLFRDKSDKVAVVISRTTMSHKNVEPDYGRIKPPLAADVVVQS